MRTRDGAVYRGQFVRGLRHGAGVLTTGEGDVYDGVFCDDAMAPDAAFTVTYADGRRYGGRVKDGGKDEQESEEDEELFKLNEEAVKMAVEESIRMQTETGC